MAMMNPLFCRRGAEGHRRSLPENTKTYRLDFFYLPLDHSSLIEVGSQGL